MLSAHRKAAWTVAAIVLFAAIRVATTWRVFSQTVDEPIHVAAGFQLVTTGHYGIELEHPPLARLLFGLGPALSGATVDRSLGSNEQGNELLYRGDRYQHNLAQVRIGNLPFLIVTLVVVALWAAEAFGPAVAIMAVALLSALPPLLGHAGVTTTDVPVTAMTTLALWCWWRWLERCSWSRTVALGVAIGLGLVSKFSFVPFFAAGAVTFLVLAVVFERKDGAAPLWRQAGKAVGQLGSTAILAGLVVWSSYGFSTGTINRWRETIFPASDPENVAARYAAFPGYDWVGPDVIERYWAYGGYVERLRGVNTTDFVDWAKAAGYPSPSAGRRGGDTMKGAPPLPPRGVMERLLDPVHRVASKASAHLRIPAPEFFVGGYFVKRHSLMGHQAFLLGGYRSHGWWYYFPVVFFFKTPVPFTLLALFGVGALAWRRRDAAALGIAAAPFVMLIPAIASGINIGIRHILPIYPLLAIAAGYGCVVLCTLELPREAPSEHGGDAAVLPLGVTSPPVQSGGMAAALRKRLRRGGSPAMGVVAVLMAWYFIGTAIAHPDYVAYFNELAGRHPERIAVDSNLDWGQDLLRLQREVRQRHIERLHIAYFGSAWLDRHIPQTEVLKPGVCATGWVAISEMKLAMGDGVGRRRAFRWLNRYPYTKVGRSIRLYSIPAGACRPGSE